MQRVRSGSSSQQRRRARARAAVAELQVRYCCPICGGDHPRPEHGLDVGADRPLDPDALRELRQQALEELAVAVERGAERDHLERVAQLVGAVDARLQRLDDGPAK